MRCRPRTTVFFPFVDRSSYGNVRAHAVRDCVAVRPVGRAGLGTLAAVGARAACAAAALTLAGCATTGSTAGDGERGAAVAPVTPIDLAAAGDAGGGRPASPDAGGDPTGGGTSPRGASAESLADLAARDAALLEGMMGGGASGDGPLDAADGDGGTDAARGGFDPGASTPGGGPRPYRPPYHAADGVERGPKIEFDDAAARARASRPAASDAPDDGARPGSRRAPEGPITDVVWGGEDTLATPERVLDPVGRPAADRDGGLDESDDPADGGSGATPRPLAPDQVAMLLVELRRVLFQESIESEQPLRELLALPLLTAIDPEAPIRPEVFRDLTEDEQVVLEALQGFVVTIRRAIDEDGDARAAVVEAVDDLRDALVPPPDFELRNLRLCWRVEGYGQYDAWDPVAFLAGQEQRTLVYAELDDFTSVETEDGEWETRIRQRIEIYVDHDPQPQVVFDWDRVVDRVPTQRRDFYTIHDITLPANLPLGRYLLKLYARDEHSGAESEASVGFRIVADENLAAK